MLQFTASFPFLQCPDPSSSGSVVVNTAPVTGPLVRAGLCVGESAVGETGDELSLHASATASIVAAVAWRCHVRMVVLLQRVAGMASPANASSAGPAVIRSTSTRRPVALRTGLATGVPFREGRGCGERRGRRRPPHGQKRLFL